MYKIYKNLIPDSTIEQFLSVIKLFPDNCWTQSICTDEDVIQLREFLPKIIMQTMYDLHKSIIPTIEEDFELPSKNIKLKNPDYRDITNGGILTIDKRLPGMSLSPHADIPTGTYERHLGTTDGTSPITISGIFYWNDDFDGGEINFHENADASILIKDKEKTDLSVTGSYKPVAGDFLVFPSHTVHSITEVKSGTRYSTQYFFNRF